MRAVDAHQRESTLFALWENALGRDRWQRENALLGGGADVPRGLGARNLAMLALRNRLFDRAWPLHSACPDCGETSAFEVDCMVLAGELSSALENAPKSPLTLYSGIAVHAPTVDDLIAVASAASTGEAAGAIAARCLGAAPPGPIDAETLEELEDAIDRLDPGAIVSFALSCPDCAHQWTSAIDIGAAIWAEVQRAAEALMVEVDALARAYGWSEPEVLGLPPARRAAYLQLVAA